jgi:hypothetical protein
MAISPQYLSIYLLDSIRFRVGGEGETAAAGKEAAGRVCGSERRRGEQLRFCFFHTGSRGKGKRNDHLKFILVLPLQET